MKNSVIRPLAAFAVLAQQMALSPNIHASTALATFGNLGASTESESVCAPQETITRAMATKLADSVTKDLLLKLSSHDIDPALVSEYLDSIKNSPSAPKEKYPDYPFYSIKRGQNIRDGLVLTIDQRIELELLILREQLKKIAITWGLENSKLHNSILQFLELDVEREQMNRREGSTINELNLYGNHLEMGIARQLAYLNYRITHPISYSKEYNDFKNSMTKDEPEISAFFKTLEILPIYHLVYTGGNGDNSILLTPEFNYMHFAGRAQVGNTIKQASEEIFLEITVNDSQDDWISDPKRTIKPVLRLNGTQLPLPTYTFSMKVDGTTNIIEKTMRDDIIEAIMKHADEARKKNSYTVDQCEEVNQDQRNADASDVNVLDVIRGTQGTRR